MIEDAGYISATEMAALKEIKCRVMAVFDITEFRLFGSKVRGDAVPDSDIDLLIVTGRELMLNERHLISDIVFEVNLSYDVLFSFIVVDARQWHSRYHELLPIHINIEREGILV